MRLACAGRELVEKKYSWEIIGKAVNSAYEEVHKRKH